MKKLFLIAGLVVVLTFGGVGGIDGVMAKPETGGGPITIARVSIEEVMCPCGVCSKKAINCSCPAAAQALNDAGFSMEDIESYLENNQAI